MGNKTRLWPATSKQKVSWLEPDPVNSLPDLTEELTELTTHFEHLLLPLLMMISVKPVIFVWPHHMEQEELMLTSSKSWEVECLLLKFWVKSVFGRRREKRMRRRRRRRRGGSRRRGRLRLRAAISPQLGMIQIVQYHKVIISLYHSIPMMLQYLSLQ